MSRMTDVTIQDVSRVIRLVQEVCDRWDDPRVWREHLLNGACSILGGRSGFIVADPGGEEGRFGKLAPVAIVGLNDEFAKRLRTTVTQAAGQPRSVQGPGADVIGAELKKNGWLTATRDELADPAAYHASQEYLELRKPMDLDDFLLSVRFVDVPRRAEAITIDRPHGADPFGPRETTLLKLLHDEIAPLIGVRLATEDHLSRDGLSRRLREALSLLLDGKSEKEVAAAMGIGSRTVHEYVTAIYEHFRVSSRPELLAYFVRRQPRERASA
jgi:DNA-binding CsgD family transcriptional regulator